MTMPLLKKYQPYLKKKYRLPILPTANVPATYIADGHHRAASAAKVRKALGNTATENADYFLTTLFPSNQLAILDYNRVITDLNGLDEAGFLSKLEEKFVVEKVTEQHKPPAPHEFGLYLQKQWYKLTAKPDTFNANDAIEVLDISIMLLKFWI